MALLYVPHTFGQVWGLTLTMVCVLAALVLDSYSKLSPEAQAQAAKRLTLFGLGAATVAAYLLIVAPDCWYWFCW